MRGSSLSLCPSHPWLNHKQAPQSLDFDLRSRGPPLAQKVFSNWISSSASSNNPHWLFWISKQCECNNLFVFNKKNLFVYLTTLSSQEIPNNSGYWSFPDPGGTHPKSQKVWLLLGADKINAQEPFQNTKLKQLYCETNGDEAHRCGGGSLSFLRLGRENRKTGSLSQTGLQKTLSQKNK